MVDAEFKKLLRDAAVKLRLLEHASALFSRVADGERQHGQSTVLRDHLLPKRISGELHVLRAVNQNDAVVA